MAKKKHPTVGDLTEALDQIAPPHLAQSWDNVGLLVGDRRAPCEGVLLCIDLTPPVLAEAIRKRVNFVFAYHPPLFRPISRLRADSGGTDAIVHRAIALGLAVYSSHTALDAAEGGTNDVLASLAGLRETEPFEYVGGGSGNVKVVTFVPAEALDRVAAAMFDAGAGHIGDYEQCSYRLKGEGTFFGTESTQPRVGRKGRLERVQEVRLEMVASRDQAHAVVAALRAHHPYEEPPFDLYPLERAPSKGIGRVGQLPRVVRLSTLTSRLKQATGSRIATHVGSPRTRVRKVAVCVGSAGSLPLEKPLSADCDVVVTGEMRHHDALTLLRQDKAAVVLGHWESERPILPVLARRLKQSFGQVPIQVSRSDAAPFAPTPS